MTDLLFDTPWWLPVAIAVVGIALFASGNNRQKSPLRNVGLGVVALAGVLLLVSYLVDTDKEKVIDRTNALVRSVGERDWKTFTSLLDPQTSFAGYVGRDQLAEGARLSAETFGVKSTTVLGREVKDDQTLITVTVDALSQQDTPPYPLRSTWDFDWQQRGDEWLLYEIRMISVNETMTAESDLTRRLPKLPQGQQ